MDRGASDGLTSHPAIICGVDEAGRGPLAGPVFAAAVILDAARPIAGLADSKKLTPKARERLTEEIRSKACAWAVASADVAEIDRLNILQATLLAMTRAVKSLEILPGLVLVDGLHCPPIDLVARAIVKGDDTVEEICAASILAKTARDAVMLDLHARHPQYGFHRHKGYPTREHIAALRKHGVIEAHRRSFAPVRLLLQQAELPWS